MRMVADEQTHTHTRGTTTVTLDVHACRGLTSNNNTIIIRRKCSVGPQLAKKYKYSLTKITNSVEFTYVVSLIYSRTSLI